MALLTPTQLSEILVTSMENAGVRVGASFDPASRPMELQIDDAPVRVFLWNISPGGASRSPDERRVQTRRPASVPLFVPGRRTLLLGYHDQFKAFGGWDPRFHPNPGVSSSLQVHVSQLEEAVANGMAARTRNVDLGIEVVMAFVPGAIRTYLEVAVKLPPPGTSAAEMATWARAGSGEEDGEGALPTGPRKEAVRQVRIKVRDTRFRATISRIYGGRCAFCGLGASLIEAAHIMGVGEGGSDEVTNGVALCPNHHAAFDKGLLLVGEDGRIIVNRRRLVDLNVSKSEIAALGRGLLAKARTPAAKRFHPDAKLLATHRERWRIA